MNNFWANSIILTMALMANLYSYAGDDTFIPGHIYNNIQKTLGEKQLVYQNPYNKIYSGQNNIFNTYNKKKSDASNTPKVPYRYEDPKSKGPTIRKAAEIVLPAQQLTKETVDGNFTKCVTKENSNSTEAEVAPQETFELVAGKPTRKDLFKMCRGGFDTPKELHTKSNSNITSARDYIYTKALQTRNINGAKKEADNTCAKTDWKNVHSVLQVKQERDPKSKHISIQDYIDYRCHLSPLSCKYNSQGRLQNEYANSRKKYKPTARQKISDKDDFFSKIEERTKFLDKNTGKVVSIPKSFTLAIMKNESSGQVTKKSYAGDYGLFQINKVNVRKVKRDSNGVVTGLEKGSYSISTDASDKNSISLPENNIAKFTQVIMAKYNHMMNTFNGKNGSLDFSTMPESEKWMFISAAYNGGEGTITSPLKRLTKFNHAQKCNPCSQFKPDDLKQCKTIKLKCEAKEIKNACNETVPVSMGTLDRFHNFLGSNHDPDYNEHMKCLVKAAKFKPTKGPCNVGITFTYARNLAGLRQCY